MNTVEWFKRKNDFAKNFRLCQPSEPLVGYTPDEVRSVQVAKELHFIVEFREQPPSMSEYDIW